jgi:hypothetical protein
MRSRRKEAAALVEAVLAARLQTPLAGPAALVARVDALVGRQDRTAANIQRAWAQRSCGPGLRARRRPLEAGTGQDQEPDW